MYVLVYLSMMLIASLYQLIFLGCNIYLFIDSRDYLSIYLVFISFFICLNLFIHLFKTTAFVNSLNLKYSNITTATT